MYSREGTERILSGNRCQVFSEGLHSISTPEVASYFAYKTGCLTSVFPCEYPHYLFLRS